MYILVCRSVEDFFDTGGVGPEPRVPGTSWTALTLEVGKSPSCSWSLNRAVRETGANMVSKTQERALDPLLVPALLALATPSICWLRSAAASDTLAQHRCNSTALRATTGCSARASELSNLVRHACAQPAAQSPGDARACVSSCGLCWARS